MKKLKLLFLALLVLYSFAHTEAQNKKIDVSKSLVTWTGKKITGQHEGTLKFKEGVLVFNNNKVVGGNFVVDMTTLSNTDQSGSSKAKLEGHLKSDDFLELIISILLYWNSKALLAKKVTPTPLLLI